MEEKLQSEADKYSYKYSESSLMNKVMKVAKKAGINVIYTVLLLYYTLQKPVVPTKVKAAITGALGYFILPVDIISDLIPLAGYTDDLGVLAGAIVIAAMYIDDEVKQQARGKLKDWFGDYDESLIEEVDEKVNSNK